ncbi:hypothetical protein J437_LFUL016251 [Ladona fulva]|uniref:PiggyBac transposable element-derived protein domain-containing protein n=1 Tax=Ladona fulva TaxID=123851 RepID=A0A8K0PBE7_LADFU|nr:hypothetical protein J437_LFUL016251 [Ladona fulva]
MARNRFEHILQFISNVMFGFGLWRLFEAFEDIKIDEQLVHGRCLMNQYMKSKSAKYGIKIWAAADVKMSYLYNLQA